MRILSTPVEHHAVLDPLLWLAAEGAKVELVQVDHLGRLDVEAFRAAVESDPESVALVTVMWANNEVGTVQPVSEVVEIARAHGIPVHTDAVQALGQLPLDFAASGVDAMTVTGHKVGGPYGVGALLVRRELQLTALLHGGGQERDIRSGTIDPPAIAGFAVACESAVQGREPLAERLTGLRDSLVAGVLREVPDAIYNGDPQSGPRAPAPRQCAPGVPGLRGGLPADAARRARHRVLDGVGLRRRGAPGLARPAGDGLLGGVRALLAALLAGPQLDRLRRAGAHRGDRPGRRAGPQRGALLEVVEGLAPGSHLLMRVLAAMSGGVDSAVAAARAVEQGHEVTGIHLALSRNPKSYRTGARGCCTIEDANDARRAADVIGIPFYVWDLSERFHEDVVEDFLSEYAEGRTPNPCLRCNEKIKFAAVLDRALALGFDAVVTGHYAQLRTGPDGLIAMHRAEDMSKDQSYVLGVLTQDQLAHSLFPLGDTPKSVIREEAARRGLAVAAKPDSHDICFISDGDTGGWLAEKLDDVNRGGSIVDDSGEVLGEHQGSWRYTIGQRRGLRIGTPAADGRPRYVLDIEPVSGTVTVGSRAALAVAGLEAIRPRWCGTAPTPGVPLECTVQLRAHGEEHRATVTVVEGELPELVRVELLDPASGIAPGQAVVVYDGSRVVGSATISLTHRVAAAPARR